MRLAGARRPGNHGERCAETLHYGLSLLGIERQHFENRAIVGWRKLHMLAIEPLSERSMAHRRFVELHQFAQFDFEAVCVWRRVPANSTARL